MSNSLGEPETTKPYETATGPSSTETPNPLFIPGIIFLLDSLVWLLFIVFVLAHMLSPNYPFRDDELVYVQIATAYGLMFLLALIASAGAVAMMMLKWKWLAWTGCIVGMLPLFGPCCGLTIPIAIWGVVLLRRPEISARFT